MSVLLRFQKIKSGGMAYFSLFEIANLIINLPDAKKNLTAEQYNGVYNLFLSYKSYEIGMEMDYGTYCKIAIELIKEFDKIAPYEKYSGGDENEFLLMMEDIRSDSILPSDGKFYIAFMKNSLNAKKKKHTFAKVMVWIFLFLAYSCLSVSINLRMGAIPTLIVYGSLIWIARRVCKAIDRRNSANIPQMYATIILSLLCIIASWPIYSGNIESYETHTVEPEINTNASTIQNEAYREQEFADILTDIYDNSDLEYDWEIEVQDDFVVVWLEIDGLIDLIYEAKLQNIQLAKEEWDNLISKMIDWNIEDNDFAEEYGYEDVLVGLNLIDPYSKKESIYAIIADGTVLFDVVNDNISNEEETVNNEGNNNSGEKSSTLLDAIRGY